MAIESEHAHPDHTGIAGLLGMERLWSLLRRVATLRFEARTQAGTGWEGVGTGAVQVSEPAVGVLVFAESGVWQPAQPDRPALRFQNVFRWTRLDAAIRLEHLRFGAENPVHLFDLAPVDGEQWCSVGNHLCRADCYSATVIVDNGRLLVAWAITGPRKSESISYTYWPAAHPDGYTFQKAMEIGPGHR